MTPARLVAELMRVATHTDRVADEVDAFGKRINYDNIDFGALDALVAMDPPLVLAVIPRAFTEDGARVVAELLATFEEQV
jgi:hypothetical protein